MFDRVKLNTWAGMELFLDLGKGRLLFCDGSSEIWKNLDLLPIIQERGGWPSLSQDLFTVLKHVDSDNERAGGGGFPVCRSGIEGPMGTVQHQFPNQAKQVLQSSRVAMKSVGWVPSDPSGFPITCALFSLRS